MQISIHIILPDPDLEFIEKKDLEWIQATTLQFKPKSAAVPPD